MLDAHRAGAVPRLDYLFGAVLQDALRIQPLAPQRQVALRPRPMAITERRVGRQQGQDAVRARTLLADPQRVPEAVRLAVRVVERDAVLAPNRDQRCEHVRAGREEHHRLSVLQLLHGALEDESLRRLVRTTREPLHRAILRSRKIDLLLASGRSEERRVGKECRSRWSPY